MLHWRATSLLANPSAASSNADACTTFRCGSDLERAICSRALRCMAVMANGGAVTSGMVTLYLSELYQRRTTSRASSAL